MLVIGGGIVGAAAACDAAQRGLATALVEAADFGSGASWNSLKTIHGGLRHLQRADLAAHRESCRERSTLLRIGPEVVRPLGFLVPAYGHGPKGIEVLAAGVVLNDVLAADRNRGLREDRRLPRAEVLGPAEVRTRVPGIEARGLSGGVVWTDAQVTSSERLLLGFLRAAAEHGAALANYARVDAITRDGRRVAGATVADVETGTRYELRARCVVNAAGPAMDAVLALAGLRRPPVPLLQALNLVLARPVVTHQAVGARVDGRYLFLVPWAGRAIAGTAYEPEGRPLEAAVFLEQVQRAYPWAELKADDVVLEHRGLVPGRGGADGLETHNRLLDHARTDGVEGLVSAQAVKYTTARALAEAAVDQVAARLGRGAACRTGITPLAWARPLPGAPAEAAREAVRSEMARTLADAVRRRLDLGTAGPPDPAALEEVARALQAELGWTESQLRREKEAVAAAYPAPGYRMSPLSQPSMRVP